ncbi:MAG: hypothetical protein AB7U85_00505 [Alphaproteobacteria bacterium]
MKEEILQRLKLLPKLWATEAIETSDLSLPLCLRCNWHNLLWYPVEFDEQRNIIYGLTVKSIPEWRHFHVEELFKQYQRQPVIINSNHICVSAPEVPEIARFMLDDITPFIPMNVKDI